MVTEIDFISFVHGVPSIDRYTKQELQFLWKQMWMYMKEIFWTYAVFVGCNFYFSEISYLCKSFFSQLKIWRKVISFNILPFQSFCYLQHDTLSLIFFRLIIFWFSKRVFYICILVLSRQLAKILALRLSALQAYTA